jgi:protein involved in polysaccharide export with SLBB domain
MRSDIRSLLRRLLIAMFAAFLGLILICSGPPLAAQESTVYRVGPGDQLEVNVFRAPDLTWRATVDVDGLLAYPPLGRLQGTGLTIAEIEMNISDGLSKVRILGVPKSRSR